MTSYLDPEPTAPPRTRAQLATDYVMGAAALALILAAGLVRRIVRNPR